MDENMHEEKQEHGYDAFELFCALLDELNAIVGYCRSVSALPNCNSCTNRECGYLPKEGEDLRINCPLWRRRQ